MEYALNSLWLDKHYLGLDRFWLDGTMPVTFVFYEEPVTCNHFVLRPGYEKLADEMVRYAETAFPLFAEPVELVMTKDKRH